MTSNLFSFDEVFGRAQEFNDAQQQSGKNRLVREDLEAAADGLEGGSGVMSALDDKLDPMQLEILQEIYGPEAEGITTILMNKDLLPLHEVNTEVCS